MSDPQARVYAVVPAAGVGRRMGADTPKQYLEVHGQSVLAHTLARLAGHPRVEHVIVAIANDDEYFTAIEKSLPDTCSPVPGGAERCDSVLAGLRALEPVARHSDWIIVHDAARPCVRREDIDRMLNELAQSPVGGILAVPVRDTLKRGDANHAIEATVDRTALWHALTPQMFRFGLLTEALEAARNEGVMVTDDAQALERLGHKPLLVAGSSDNIKITHPQDLGLAALILAAQADAARAVGPIVDSSFRTVRRGE